MQLIKMYDNMIIEYKDFKNSSSTGDYIVNGAFHPVLSPAVSAVITFFNTGGLFLAAELLTYAKETSTGGTYTPYWGKNVYQTSEYTRIRNQIRTSGAQYASGSSTFTKGSSTYNNDLYYAIHHYNYEYNRGRFTITDYYDYDVNPEYEGIAGTAINTMYQAQLLGVIVPYNVQFTLSL